MSFPFFDCIKKKYSSIVKNSCSDGKYYINIDDYRNTLILKPDEIYRETQMCDNILFSINGKILMIVVAEYKGKSPDTTDILNQITYGIGFLNTILSECFNNDYSIEFYPISIADRWQTPQVVLLNKRKVKFRGVKYQIIRGKRGDKLYSLIRKR